MGRRVRNLISQVHGRLTVIGAAPDGPSGKKWVCQCSCGEKTVVYGTNLKSGSIKSCGCGRIKHGMLGTKLHHVWRTMLDRCRNPNANQYDDYGGRGIVVCKEWLDFSNFFAEMGHPPSGGTLERVNNDGPYCKSNCCWLTRRQQARNKRNNRFVTAFGRTQIVTDWAIEYGIPPRTLFNRLYRAKMEPEEALTTGLYAQQKQRRD